MLQGRLRPEQVLGGMFGTGGGFGTSSGGFYVIGRKGRRRPAVGLSLWGNLWLDWGETGGHGCRSYTETVNVWFEHLAVQRVAVSGKQACSV